MLGGLATANADLPSLSFGHLGKLLIKPSRAAVRPIRERLRTELRSLCGSNAQAVLRRLNPIIRGWAADYRTQVSGETFKALDYYLWRLTFRWAKVSHSTKPAYWLAGHRPQDDRRRLGTRHLTTASVHL